MVSRMTCYIGLGSNLDKPLEQIKQAISELGELSHCTLIASSSLYRSTAIGPGEQPDYINAVAKLESTLTPITLLNELQQLEQQHQRQRSVRWGPRTLDLDILLLDDFIIKSERLSVPHPCLTERNFVLYPLAEVEPELILPNQLSIQQLLTQTSTQGLELLS